MDGNKITVEIGSFNDVNIPGCYVFWRRVLASFSVLLAELSSSRVSRDRQDAYEIEEQRKNLPTPSTLIMWVKLACVRFEFGVYQNTEISHSFSRPSSAQYLSRLIFLWSGTETWGRQNVGGGETKTGQRDTQRQLRWERQQQQQGKMRKKRVNLPFRWRSRKSCDEENCFSLRWEWAKVLSNVIIFTACFAAGSSRIILMVK